MIKVMLVNCYQLMGSVLAAALSDTPDIRVIGSTTRVDEALNLILRSNCNVVVVSANLPDGGALEITRAVRANPPIPVLVIGLARVEKVILRYAEAGVAGYVFQGDSMGDLVDNIRAVNRGETLVSPEIAAALIAHATELAEIIPCKAARAGVFTELTAREREVLDLIGDGLSNQEIANRLNLEPGAVKRYVNHILQKLDLNSRHDAAMYWGRLPPS